MYVMCNFFVVTARFYPRYPDPPLMLADPIAVNNACEVLRSAERPLVIIGKGKTLYLYFLVINGE